MADQVNDNNNQVARNANQGRGGAQRADRRRPNIPPYVHRARNMSLLGDPRVARNEYDPITYKGATVPVNMLIADGDEESSDLLASLCWSTMVISEDYRISGAAFASFAGLFSSKLRDYLFRTLDKHGIQTRVLICPEETVEQGLKPSPHTNFSMLENVVYFTVCIMLIFKQLSDQNFDGYVSARVKAIAGRVGIPYNEAQDLQFPLDLEQTLLMRKSFSGLKKVKAELIRYLVWAGDGDSILSGPASYACILLSYNEMSVIMFILQQFVRTMSPVMKEPFVQNEAVNFCNAMDALYQSSCPQFFAYFCSRKEEGLIHRRNFRLLAATAQRLMAEDSSNRSMANFAGSTNATDTRVDTLVMLHNNHERSKHFTSSARTMRLLFGDDRFEDVLEDKPDDPQIEELPNQDDDMGIGF